MYKHLLTLIVSGFFLMASPIFAQKIELPFCPPPIPGLIPVFTSTTSDVACDFYGQPVGLGFAETAFFILYDDGQFDQGMSLSGIITRTHHFETGGPHTIMAWFAKDKDTSPPPARTIVVNTPFAATPAPIYPISGNLEIGTSWGPVYGVGHFQFVVLTVKNGTDCKRTVDLEFLYKSDQSMFDASAPSSPAWGTPVTIPGPIGSFDRSLTLTNIVVPPNSVQNLFLKLSIPIPTSPVPSVIDYQANILNSAFSLPVLAGHPCKMEDNSKLTFMQTKSAYPHDPNHKIANQTFLCAGADSATLEYHISFQNDGEAEAKNIVITDILDDIQLDPYSLTITGSSHYPIVYNFTPPNIATFTFPDINLPGINQTTPPPISDYMYSKTIGEFSFTINTLANLDPGSVILNSAEIVFDKEDPVETNLSKVPVLENSDQYPCIPRERSDLSVHTADIKISASPNPFSENLSIQPPPLKPGETAQVKIFDFSGKKISSKTISGHATLDFQTETWPSGIYFVQLQGVTGVATLKVMKY